MPTDPMNPDQRERRARFLVIGLLVAALGVFAIGGIVSVVQDTTAIRKVPPSERLELYRHAIDELETICLEPAATSGSLRDHCTAQAQFVLQLPECTESCRRAATIVLPHARR